MGNSRLVNYTLISKHKNSPRKKKIDTITIHHMAGNLSVKTCGEIFQKKRRSSNYGIDSKGNVGLYVDEKDRSWCSSSYANDHRAITIEVANDVIGGNWHVSDVALNKLIELCFDICVRNGIKRLNYTGDKKGNLTMHCWFSPTACPGPYLKEKFPYIAERVNAKLYAIKPEEHDDTSIASFLPKRGYFKCGDSSNNVAKVAKFMRKVFPSYTSRKALGKIYGPNIIRAITEFQKRTGLKPDGYLGPITLNKLIDYGFKI